MGQPDVPETVGFGSIPELLTPHGGRLRIPRAFIFATIAILSGYLSTRGIALWGEYMLMRRELERVEASTIVGYPNIHPDLSFARKPPNWFRVEHDAVYLWAGWKDKVGHRWFRIAPGDMDQARITDPIGKDVHRAIDRPLVDVSGGPIWERIPSMSQVAAHDLQGLPCAYPIPILNKVQLVNDIVADHPYLILYNPNQPLDRAVSIFDSSLGGHRVTLGSSGFYLDRRPVVYDRGTESLWVETEAGLTAISGRRKGTTMPRIARPIPVSWGDLRGRNPQTRLIAGSEPRPSELPSE